MGERGRESANERDRDRNRNRETERQHRDTQRENELLREEKCAFVCVHC